MDVFVGKEKSTFKAILLASLKKFFSRNYWTWNIIKEQAMLLEISLFLAAYTYFYMLPSTIFSFIFSIGIMGIIEAIRFVNDYNWVILNRIRNLISAIMGSLIFVLLIKLVYRT